MKTFTKILMGLSISIGLVACGPDGGSSSSDPTWVGQPVDSATATGSAQFVGAWKYESLDAQITCSDGKQGQLTTVSGTETFTHGARRDQILGVDDDGCRSDCQVSGNTATCQTDVSACGGEGIAVTEDVYTYANGSISEYSSMQFVARDGTACVASGTARLVPMK